MKNESQRRFLSIKEVRGIFNISRGTERRWRDGGNLPQPVRMGKLIMYKKTDIDKISQ